MYDITFYIMPSEDITHLILGSGAHNGFDMVGATFQLKDKKFFYLENIHTIYATSAGTIVATLLLLSKKIEDQTIVDYIVERPWDKLIQITPNTILNMIWEKGLLDKKFIYSVFSNIFACHPQDIKTSVTLYEFYTITHTTLYIYSTQISNMSSILFSHKSHPDLPLLDAIYMSVSIPIVFKPTLFQGEYMIDGGVANPYPIELCINQKVPLDKILHIKIKRKRIDHVLHSDNTNLLTYIFTLFNNIRKKLQKLERKNITENNLLIINIDSFEGYSGSSGWWNGLQSSVTDLTTRKKCIQRGRNYADSFLKNRENKS